MSETPVRHRTRQRARRKLRITLISIGAVLAVLTAGVGVYALSLAQRIDNVQKIEIAFPDDALRPPVSRAEGSKPLNILLLGSDTRGSISNMIDRAKGSRSDTMMIAHIPSDRSSIQVMSLMRDLWVDIPGHGTAKLNAAMAYGGVPLTVQTIENLIGARIDHIAMVDFEGFKGVTDALGGVSVDNPIAFSGGDSFRTHFPKGVISLNGEEALAFVRERYAFAGGDYQRVRNQQLFIKAMLGEILSRETLTNPVTISNLVDGFAPFIAVDSGFNSSFAVSLGMGLKDLRTSDVRFFTMPTLGTGWEGSQSIVKMNWDELSKIQAAFIDDTLSKYTPPETE